MNLTPLGCLAGMPAGGLASSGYVVDAGDQRILLDAGPGTALGLTACPGRRVTGAVISHEHTDHLLDLLVIGKILLNDRLVRSGEGAEAIVDETVPAVPLYVPEGAPARLRQLARLYPVATYPLLDRAFELGFEVHEYHPGQVVRLGDVSVRLELLRHAAPNCGVRVEHAGRSLVYTGDTGVTDALPALASGADMLLAESTLRESDPTGHGHLSPREAGRAAQDARVGQLVLTHFSTPDPADHAWHAARASGVFDGPVHTAHPGTTLSLPSPRKVLW